jgi:4-hydroxy-tetrahydrodipicolinate synthase
MCKGVFTMDDVIKVGGAMSLQSLYGCGTALVTPFEADGSLDEAGLCALIEWQIEQGIHFLVPCGSTGEAATLSLDEHLRVVEITVEQAGGRVPVVAGAGNNDTAKCIDLCRAVAACGATHLLVVSPAYNRPPQRGLIAHFEAVADAVDVPILIYNVPGRTACNLEAATTLALAEHPRVIGIKEASGDLDQINEVILKRPDGFSVFSGDDPLTLPIMALGAEGVVSVVSNAAPRGMSDLVNAMQQGDLVRARQLQAELSELMIASFVESNPMPIKAALAELGRIGATVRSPLTPLTEAHRATVEAAMSGLMDSAEAGA